MPFCAVTTGRYRSATHFAWVVPNMAVLLLINGFTNREFLLEVGAGTGLWSSLLRCLGSHVVATDAEPPENTFSPVEELDALAAVSAFDLEAQTLLMVWPPNWSDMASQALNAFRGPRMVYVGETRGGCTGDERFFDLLERTGT